MPKYKVLKWPKGSSPIMSDARVRGRRISSEAKGRKVIGGKRYLLWTTADTLESANRVAQTKREQGHSVRILKSKYYGDYNVWIDSKR